MSSPQIDEFWQLLASVADPRGPATMFDSLVRELGRRPIPRICRFQQTLIDLTDQARTWDLRTAADIVFQLWGGVSDDDFVSFRLWLVGHGRVTFERAVRYPDSLADNAVIQRFAAGDHENEAFPHFEDLTCAADEAFELVLSKLAPSVAARIERPDELDLRPRADSWAPRPQQPARHSRLARLFHVDL